MFLLQNVYHRVVLTVLDGILMKVSAATGKLYFYLMPYDQYTLMFPHVIVLVQRDTCELYAQPHGRPSITNYFKQNASQDNHFHIFKMRSVSNCKAHISNFLTVLLMCLLFFWPLLCRFLPNSAFMSITIQIILFPNVFRYAWLCRQVQPITSMATRLFKFRL